VLDDELLAKIHRHGRRGPARLRLPGPGPERPGDGVALSGSVNGRSEARCRRFAAIMRTSAARPAAPERV
jgi:hypothetical protein